MTLEAIHPADCDAARGIYDHVMRTLLLNQCWCQVVHAAWGNLFTTTGSLAPHHLHSTERRTNDANLYRRGVDGDMAQLPCHQLESKFLF